MDHSNLWSRRVWWLALSAFAASMIFLAITAIRSAIRGELPDWWPQGPIEAILFVVIMGFFSLPWLLAYAFVMLWLAKRRRASLLESLLIGGFLGVTSFLVLAWTLGADLSEPAVVDITASLAMSVVPAFLFWWFVIRKERQINERQAHDAAAIAAME